MCHMVLSRRGVYQNVIHEHDHNLIKVLFEDSIHQVYECYSAVVSLNDMTKNS